MTDSIGTNQFDIIPNAHADANNIIECVVIPAKLTVIFPNIVSPILLEHKQAQLAGQFALENKLTALVVPLKSLPVGSISPENLTTFGTEIAAGRILANPNYIPTLLAQGRRRVQILEITQEQPYIVAKAVLISEVNDENNHDAITNLTQIVHSLLESIVDLSDLLDDDVLSFILSCDDPIWLTDFVVSTINASFEERLQVLQTENLVDRLKFVIDILNRELDLLEVKDTINEEIQHEMARNQRELYLREQLQAIQSELGEEDIFQQEINELRQNIAKAEMPQEAEKQAYKELGRLAMLPPMSPEVGVIRTYLDWIVSIPWQNKSEDNLDLASAQTILDENHYGLPKVKDRIIEHIAVRKLAADKMKSPILCFVGPPGVGKTSLGKSIATALGREFVRVSLGGVRDEAEIRGHRRTYIGSLPGRIIQTMRRAGTINPVFVLDEIDKLGNDFRGDPSSALLEVLDPEQNNAFSDHYLDLDYDLSNVMFITTANDLYPVPPALLDRLELVEFPGYAEEDKLNIAVNFLIPKQLEAHGLAQEGIRFQTSALQSIIRNYTYEAGVRNLDREIANVCRKLARLVAEEKKHPKRITDDHITTYLGPPQSIGLRANKEDSIGVATGLAWTSGGGDVLTIEISILPGKGALTLTGQLGEVMQESAQTALSYARSRANDFHIPHDDFDNFDLHIHLPEGAIPKDGPSAGITLAVAIISALTEAKIRSDYAMTGEITLRGNVLPVGGVIEKVLAARRNQIYNIILPVDNQKDIVDIPKKALRNMNLIFVENMQQVLDAVLHEPPTERQRDNDANDDQDSDD